MAGGTEVFHRRITRRRALVGVSKQQQQHQKPFEGEKLGPHGAKAIRVPKNELDIADFLIDGLTCGRASGAWVFGVIVTARVPFNAALR